MPRPAACYFFVQHISDPLYSPAYLCLSNQTTQSVECQNRRLHMLFPTARKGVGICLSDILLLLLLIIIIILHTIRRWNWYCRRLEDGRPTLQAMPGSPPSCSSICPWHYRGGMRSHFKTRSQPASSLPSVVALPRDAIRKRGLCCEPASVCPSVTLVHCVHTAEDIVKLLCQPGSPIILVF